MARSGGQAREASLPALLGAAQRTYTNAIRSALSASGFEDMPRTGYWITGLLAREGSGLGDLASRLTVSKQATSRLIDVLVRRDYCARVPDPTDRRRTTLVLTDRGHRAAAEIRRAVARLNEDVSARVDADGIAATRATLATLVAMGRETRAGASGAPAALR